MEQANVYMHSSNSMKGKKINEVSSCVCKNVDAKDFIQHKYCGSMFTSLFLHSL